LPLLYIAHRADRGLVGTRRLGCFPQPQDTPLRRTALRPSRNRCAVANSALRQINLDTPPPIPSESPIPALLRRVLASGAVSVEDYESLNPANRTTVDGASEESSLGVLVACGLLTDFQAERVRTGRLHGLVLGNYRLLARIGIGGMGVVYRGEHRQ